MTNMVTAKFVLKALLAIAIGVFLALLEESKRKIMAALPDLPFFKLLRSSTSSASGAVDYYSGEILYNEVAGGGGVTGASHILMMYGTSPSLVSVPIKDVIASIKWRLAVMEYGDFLAKRGIGIEEDELGNRGCAVCWERIERKDEIREMVNCSHAFHRDCLDRWLDEGHITCPLCRSSLIPPNTNPWRIAENDLNRNYEIQPSVVLSDHDAESDLMISLQDRE